MWGARASVHLHVYGNDLPSYPTNTLPTAGNSIFLLIKTIQIAAKSPDILLIHFGLTGVLPYHLSLTKLRPHYFLLLIKTNLYFRKLT